MELYGSRCGARQQKQRKDTINCRPKTVFYHYSTVTKQPRLRGTFYAFSVGIPKSCLGKFISRQDLRLGVMVGDDLGEPAFRQNGGNSLTQSDFTGFSRIDKIGQIKSDRLLVALAGKKYERSVRITVFPMAEIRGRFIHHTHETPTQTSARTVAATIPK